ncbi:unnamed protein product [Rangifer tarandus platyrhynchus]|uniref:Uncharacterized protein n=3 Tax=Rangifer tarandus platyrhynchus TaxID=3082113 RepID=A0ACB0DXW3_RANTA|nr:unnamed protein product [Rangifer tarandus platyrhynchus]CAI9692973.1 unnamed protein product [Rangifer tarandus platyrhynchus]
MVFAEQSFSNGGSWSRSLIIIWELVKNAEFWTFPEAYESESLGVEGSSSQISVLKPDLHLTQSYVRCGQSSRVSGAFLIPTEVPTHKATLSRVRGDGSERTSPGCAESQAQLPLHPFPQHRCGARNEPKPPVPPLLLLKSEAT